MSDELTSAAAGTSGLAERLSLLHRPRNAIA
jgi:hypothetical protein